MLFMVSYDLHVFVGLKWMLMICVMLNEFNGFIVLLTFKYVYDFVVLLHFVVSNIVKVILITATLWHSWVAYFIMFFTHTHTRGL